MKRRVGLDIARVGAIALVLVSHFAKRFEFLGVFGVELFFALSGFLIGGVLYQALLRSPRWSMEDVRIFWLRRWYRTVPNYFLFLLVSLFFHAYFGGLPTFGQFVKYMVFAQNLMSGENPFYGVSWSLAVEEWFYLLFPLSILALTVLGLNKRAAFIGTTIVFLVVPPLLREYALHALNAPVERVRLMTLPRLDAIFYGVAMAFYLAKRGMSARMRLCAFWAGCAGVAIFLGLYASRASLEVTYRTAYFLLPMSFALTLPWLKELSDMPERLEFLRQPILNISLWSYSIYLSHIPVLFVVYALFGSSREFALVNFLSKVVGFTICILISRFIYERFEMPLTAMRPPERAQEAGAR